MVKGISIHVGINQVNPALFNAPELRGCENDAIEMFNIARAGGFSATDPILGQNATFDRVQTTILDAARELEEGDIFLFTFAGHGSRRADENNDEIDFLDETILLFDRILIDDYLRRALWSQFKRGVRIVGVADSCHSGTVLLASLNIPAPESVGSFPHSGSVEALKAKSHLSASPALAVAPGADNFSRVSRPQRQSGRKGRADLSKQPRSNSYLRGIRQTGKEETPTGIPVAREISTEASKAHLDRFPDIYEKLQNAIPTGDAEKLKANLLTLAACKDREKTPDGVPNGMFTGALLEVFNSNAAANYDDLIKEVGRKLVLAGRLQTPVLKFTGPGQNFSGQRPFSI